MWETASLPLQRTVLSETNGPGHSWVQLVYPRMALPTWALGIRPAPGHAEHGDMTFLPKLPVVTKTSHPDSEMCKCLKTNTYFLVRKELSFFHYCSLNSNSQKGLGFKVHSEIACSINEEAMFSSVVTATECFRNSGVPILTCNVFIGEGTLDLFLCPLWKLKLRCKVPPVTWVEGQHP